MTCTCPKTIRWRKTLNLSGFDNLSPDYYILQSYCFDRRDKLVVKNHLPNISCQESIIYYIQLSRIYNLLYLISAPFSYFVPRQNQCYSALLGVNRDLCAIGKTGQNPQPDASICLFSIKYISSDRTTVGGKWPLFTHQSLPLKKARVTACSIGYLTLKPSICYISKF